MLRRKACSDSVDALTESGSPPMNLSDANGAYGD